MHDSLKYVFRTVSVCFYYVQPSIVECPRSEMEALPRPQLHTYLWHMSFVTPDTNWRAVRQQLVKPTLCGVLMEPAIVRNVVVV